MCLLIEDAEAVTNRIRGIRILGDELRTVPWAPGQHAPGAGW
jgi:hypothetical protein